jgi:hypothetical protein
MRKPHEKKPAASSGRRSHGSPEPADEQIAPASDPTSRPGRAKAVVNWVLTLLTIPAAIVVVVVAIGFVMSTAGCTGSACTGPGSFWFGVLFYGVPVVAAVAIIASLFTARRRWGIVVPLCALALLTADLLVLVWPF